MLVPRLEAEKKLGDLEELKSHLPFSTRGQEAEKENKKKHEVGKK